MEGFVNPYLHVFRVCSRIQLTNYNLTMLFEVDTCNLRLTESRDTACTCVALVNPTLSHYRQINRGGGMTSNRSENKTNVKRLNGWLI